MTKMQAGMAAMLGTLITAAIAHSALAFPANMTTEGATNPPIGHYEFCKRLPRECTSNAGDTAPLTLTRENWKTILEVNYDTNSRIIPMTDKEIFGVEEYWAFPDGVGDCEEYVLEKRRLLIQAGISPSDLLITVVLQPNGDGHAVLTVRTDRGDFVLDNMRNKVLLWSETEYTYLKRQSVEHSGRWVKLQDGRTVAVGSVRSQ